MDPNLERLAVALADTYDIGERIGEGGTASVYRARDRRHHRDVAIKVLKPELAASLGTDRFLAEIRTTAGLQHPHILPLFDSGEAAGFVYYVTPLIEGRTLRKRLANGPLRIEEALKLTEQVGSALTYAHDRGLVHRDVKPANILLSSGRAMLSDFGIARALSEAGGDRLTATGVSIGTPEYMSPEQFETLDVDARSDLYSFACVVFEMLTGEPPITGRNAQSIFARRMQGLAPSPRSIRDAVPPAVDAAVQKAMAMSAVDRFDSVADFVQAMSDRSAAAPPTAGRHVKAVPVVLLGVAAIPALMFALRPPAQSMEADQPLAVAVLPFEFRGDSTMAAYVDVMHADVITELQGLSAIRVSGVTSSNAAATEAPDVHSFAERLGADRVLAATILRFGDSVRFSAELIDGESEDVLRTISMGGSVDHVMGLKGDFVLALADSLGVEFSTAKATRLEQLGDVDPRAYELYMRAQGVPANPVGVKEKEEILTAVLEIEPDFADAWYWLGGALILQGHMGENPRDVIPRAMEAAHRALELDPYGPAVGLFAHIAYDYEYDWPKADSLFARALELQPSAGEIHQTYGAYLTAMMRLDEAEEAIRTAAALDPLNPFWTTTIAWPMVVERPLEGLNHLESLPETHLRSPQGEWLRVFALEALGRYEDVIALADAGELTNFGDRIAAVSYALSGREDRAREIVADLAASRVDAYFPSVRIAAVHAALGDHQAALDWLEQSFDERDASLAHVREFPTFDRLADEPRYQTLLARMKFPAAPERSSATEGS